MNQIINSKNTQYINTDVFANRPLATSVQNTLFIDKDGSNGIFYSNGSTWTKVAGTGGGGGSQTFQQVLNTGNLLVSGGTQNVLGAGLNFLWDNFNSYTILSTDFTVGNSTQNYIQFNADVLHLGYLNSIGEIQLNCGNLGYIDTSFKDFDVSISTYRDNFLSINTNSREYKFGDFAQLNTSNWIKITDNATKPGIIINSTTQFTISADSKLDFYGQGLRVDTGMLITGTFNTKATTHIRLTIAGDPIQYVIPIYKA